MDDASLPRRRFVKLLALGAISLAASPHPARAAAAATPRRRRSTVSEPSRGAVEKELATERKSVADLLRTIRAFELPAGSPPAIVFRPMKARRGSRS